MLDYFFSLPLPPSVNSAYGGGSGQKRFKSKEAKAWEKEAIKHLPPVIIADPIRITYTFYFPDKRDRDIFNYEKLTTDLIVGNGVILTDSWKQLVEGVVRFGGIDKGKPRVDVVIEKLTNSEYLIVPH